MRICRTISVGSVALAAIMAAATSSLSRAALPAPSSSSAGGAAVAAKPAVSSPATINGVYALNAVQSGLINSQVLANPYVDGIALHYSWAAIEPQDGVFSWGLIDSQIAQAKARGKKVSLSVMAGYQSPSWLYAEGAEGFQFIWDMPLWGPPLCSVQKIPVPWDSIFLARWTVFVQAFGRRYGSNPAVSHVKITGINSKTHEIFLPHSVNVSVNGGQCTTFNDVANWQAIGYTRTKVEAGWQQIADTYHLFFPNMKFAAQLLPAGFPPIDANGNLISGQAMDYQVSAGILNNSIADYGLQFVGQNNGLSATWIWPTLASVSGQIYTGYQMVGVMGSGLQAAVTLAILSKAKFLEIYTTDILNPRLQPVLQSAHQNLQ